MSRAQKRGRRGALRITGFAESDRLGLNGAFQDAEALNAATAVEGSLTVSAQLTDQSTFLGLIGLGELTAKARAMQEFSFQVFEAFTAATLLYLALNLIIVLFMRRLENFVAVPGFTAGRTSIGGH